jgi:glycosyltransferase involved in cell wall biosynthesis
VEYEVDDIAHLINVIPSSIKLSVFQRNTYRIENLQDFLNAFQPDVIHSHLFEAEIVSRSCHFPQTRWFSHGHGNMNQFNKAVSFNKDYLTRLIERKYLMKRYKLNGSSTFIAISKSTLNYYRENGMKNVILLHNAIDFNRFYFEREIKNSDQNSIITLINVGTLNKRKNQIFLIDVLEQLNTLGINCCLQLVGEGPSRKYLEDEVKKKRLTNIVFVGGVNNVEDYLAKADIYLHSSIFEPFGLVLIEAMATGLPVISTNGFGNVDLIKNDYNGFVIDEYSTDLFSNKILELVSSKTKYKMISENAQKFASSFDIREYCNSLIDLYETV